jgi:hypothetical protein
MKIVLAWIVGEPASPMKRKVGHTHVMDSFKSSQLAGGHFKNG